MALPWNLRNDGLAYVDHVMENFEYLDEREDGALKYRGAWNAATEYEKNDLVSYNGGKWLALNGSTNSAPIEGANWTVFGAAPPSGTAGLFYSTPNGGTGAAALRKIVVGDLPVAGDGVSDATKIARADDGRLNNSRTPTSHSATHATGGSDPITPAQIGLGNVNNTSDANKPISTLTQSALDTKADDGAVIHKTGAENVAGTKTFSSAIVVAPPSSANHATTKSWVETYVQQFNSNLSGVPAAGVQDLTELAALAASTRSDRQTRLVEDEDAIYRYDAESTAAAQTNRVIVPADNPASGRWLKATTTTIDHNNTTGLQGGTSTERYHLTAAEKGRVPSADTTAALTGTATPNAANPFVTKDWLSDERVAVLDNTNGGANASLRTGLSNLWTAIQARATKTFDNATALEKATAIANLGLFNSSVIKNASMDATAASSTALTRSNGFTTLALTTVYDPGNNLDLTNANTALRNHYVVPVTGRYQIVTKLRLPDGATANTNYGHGAHTSNSDVPDFLWSATVTNSPQTNARNTSVNVRTGFFTAGDRIRMYVYIDSATALSVNGTIGITLLSY